MTRGKYPRMLKLSYGWKSRSIVGLRTMTTKQVLKQCNHSWKSFKKDLRTKYMYKEKSPCDKYTFIESDIWEQFVKMESTPEKMAKHAKGNEWAKLKKNPPRLGPKGYRGNIEKWEKESF